MKLLAFFEDIATNGKAARKARAEAMGFDTSQVWYHANTGGIEGEGFDNDRLPSSDPDRPFNAHWFSHEPSEFAAYPSTGNTITPVYLKLDKSKEAPHGVWRKLTAQVHKAWDAGDNERNAADMIREKLVSMGYTHAVRGREPIDAEELKRTGETSFMTSTGTKVTLKWEKMMLPGGQPEYTDEEKEIFKAYREAQKMYDGWEKYVIAGVVNKTIPDGDDIKARGVELRDELERTKALSEVANDRAWGVVNDNKEEVDSLEMYDSDVGHVTGYSDLADYERMSPEKEDIAVLDPSIIRSVHAEFNPDEAGSNKIMASIGEAADNAARLARAKAMGFDTSTPWYHGSADTDIDVFQGYRGVAGHFTTDPGWAANFADTALGNIRDNMADEDFAIDPAAETLYPVFLRLKNIFDLKNPKHRALVGIPDERLIIDYSTLEDNIKEIMAAGFDAYIDYEQSSDTDGSLAVFDPANIRSVYAKFEDGNSSSIMADISEAVGKRGPHEGIELQLMLKGTKPLAMIELRRESEEKKAVWDMLIDQGRVIHKEGLTVETPQNPNRHETDFLALPDEAWRIDRIQAVYDKVHRMNDMTDEDHIDVGNLLGYAPEDIALFVNVSVDPWGNPMNESQPARTPTVAYHATFPDNRDSIRLHGLDPKYDTTFEDGGAVYFATGATPDPKMDIWKADLTGLPVEYDNVQVAGESGWGDNEHWWYTTVNVVPDRLKLVQKGKMR